MPDGLNLFLAVMSFVLGTTIGSFLNVCIHRLPADLSVIRPASRCPKCEKPIAWYDNIPVLSWLILRAKCRSCGAPISWRYPAIEVLTGVMFFFVYWKFGPVVATPLYMLLVAGLIVVTFVDLDHWIIPNEISIPGVPIGIGCAVIGMVYKDSGLLLSEATEFAGIPMEAPVQAIVGAAAGWGFLYLLDLASQLILKKPGMGFGDVKLLAMLGAFFGVQGVIVTIVLASVFGSIIGLSVIAWYRRKAQGEPPDTEKPRPPDDEHEPTLAAHYLPFGPFLVLGGLAYLFFGPELIEAYLDFVAPSAGF
jgi:leader peptidase (prepilin peptidase) / N-methyltransferase